MNVTPALKAACSTAIERSSSRSGSVDRRMPPIAMGRVAFIARQRAERLAALAVELASDTGDFDVACQRITIHRATVGERVALDAERELEGVLLRRALDLDGFHAIDLALAGNLGVGVLLHGAGEAHGVALHVAVDDPVARQVRRSHPCRC